VIPTHKYRRNSISAGATIVVLVCSVALFLTGMFALERVGDVTAMIALSVLAIVGLSSVLGRS
jgi:hypothetical protein